MNSTKTETQKNKYCILWMNQPKFTIKGICSLMEHQSLVDIAISCGSNTLHAHKCILAASSAYFREELEKDPAIEQIVTSGFDFTVIKAIIEFMYCGETTIAEEHIKYLVAAAKLFQLKGLEVLFAEHSNYQSAAEEIYIPYPQFLTKKPKYTSSHHNFSNVPVSPNRALKPVNYNINDLYNQRKMKRKHIRAEAEKACAKEAQASRMALANLQKEIGSTPQVNSFIIEESCTETTVENFIPHTEDPFNENLNNLQQIQVVNYSNLDGCDTKPNILQLALQNTTPGVQGLTADKLKNILGNGAQSNVEIMFKTSDGDIVSVTDEVLQNLSKGGLQYQVVDENGHVGEIRDLHLIDKDQSDKVEEVATNKNVISIIPPLTTNSNNNTQTISKIIPDDYITTTLPDAVPNNEFICSTIGNPVDNLNTAMLPNNYYSLGDTLINPNMFLTNTGNVSTNTMALKTGDTLIASPNKEIIPTIQFSPDIFFADLPKNSENKENVSEKASAGE